MILLKGVRGGIQTGTEVETLEEHCSVDFSRVHSHLAFLYSQGQWAGPPTSISSQENAFRDMFTDQYNPGNSSIDVSPC